ncbi:MAG TPA: family 20 glycosylhydrolase, partial [Flavihumibacter sp.]|nr:family 20 glycosylhydrolase [Flavihumibacter sp.]
FIAVIFFLYAGNRVVAQLPVPFSIIPEPQQVSLLPGKGFDPARLKAIRLPAKTDLLIPGAHLSSLPENKQAQLVLQIDSTSNPLQQEAYTLRITATGIQISAGHATGLFYGCQSLEQLLEDAIRFNQYIPAMTITDAPAIAYRAVHFDVKHHLDHANYYYRAIDRLARYKINAIVFEFEDKLRYRRQPLVGAPHAISIEEMAALSRYAKKRNIEITPLVQGLGHASYILKHEAYQPLREIPWNDWAFCPLHEPTYQVLFDLYRDAIEATPGSRYLHIGGDEIGNIGVCERCRPFVAKYGMGQLNAYWLKRVCAFAETQNRIPVFWDDMPLQEAGLYESTWNENISAAQADSLWQDRSAILDSLLPSFPRNGVFMRWNYS